MAGERILVVDDSKENRDFIVQYILAPNGFVAIEARDGVEGLELARQQQPDLMLLDLEMPRLNGRGVLEALRRENLNIPVVLMTFHGSEEIAVEVFRLGVRDYVKKPYTTEEMMAAIDAALNETRLRSEKDALTSRLLNANRELNNRIKELNTLYAVGKTVTALVNPEQLFSRIVEAAMNVTRAEQGSLYITEADGLFLRAVKRRGETHAHPADEISTDKIADQAAATGKAVALSAAEPGPNLPSAIAAMPLKVAERVIGVLVVENFLPTVRAFTEHDGALLSALADYAAIAIENSHNFQQIEEAKEREKTEIRGAFERYVAPSMVDRMLNDPAGLSLSGARREISVLCLDVRGYGSLIAGTAPADVIDLLNQYFTLAANVIFAREGTLDKFQGDGILAVFNAPNDQADHAYRVVDAALALQAAVTEFNARRSSEGLTFSIGVKSGEALVGNIGTPHTMNYTAIGDAVNLARKLQERADVGQILVEESVIKRLGDQVKADKLGELQIRGRQTPAVVYVLKGLS